MDMITIMQIAGGVLLALIGLIWFGPKPSPRNSGRFTPRLTVRDEVIPERKRPY